MNFPMNAELQKRKQKAVRLGTAAAVLLMSLGLLAALWNPVPAIFSFSICVLFAVGVFKRIPWAAFGLALFNLATLGGLIVAIVLGRTPLTEWSTLALAGLFNLTIAWVLVRAGGEFPSRGSSAWKYASLFLAAVSFALPVFFAGYVIPTAAMENTLLVGDRILVQCFSVGQPARGQLVVFRRPQDQSPTFVKRVVAVSGDRLRLSNKKLFVNGAEQQEPFVLHMTTYVDDFRDNFPTGDPSSAPRNPSWMEVVANATVDGELVIPPGKLFVLGDNRDSSLDSRYIGFVDQSEIKGKPLLIYFSFDAPSERLNSNRISAPPLLNPSRIRWHRILKTL